MMPKGFGKTTILLEEPMTDVPTILKERAKSHGEYTDHARVTQELKHIIHNEKNWKSLTDTQKETLEIIAHKIARILVGNPNHKDHWDDIAGYAVLTADRIPQEPLTFRLPSAATAKAANPAILQSGTPEDGGHHARQKET
jgi:hypothetical protein